MRADRRGQPRRAEEGPDRLRLADERLRDRRVVEQDDPPVAAGDRLEPRLDRLHLARRLGVHLTQQRLAEVGQLRAGEAADEPLGADDADLDARRPRGPRTRAGARGCPRPRARRRPRRSGSRGSRGCRARRSPGRRGRGTRRRAPPPAPARRASSDRPRAARDRPAPPTAANACAMCSRSGSEQWMSPAAAMRIRSRMDRRPYPLAASQTATRVSLAPCPTPRRTTSPS